MDITIKWGSVLLIAAAGMLVMMRLNDIWDEVRGQGLADQNE